MTRHAGGVASTRSCAGLLPRPPGDVVGDPLGRGECGGRHDVEVPGVRREVVRGAFHLEEDRDLVSHRKPVGERVHRLVLRHRGDLDLLLEPVARHIARDDGHHLPHRFPDPLVRRSVVAVDEAEHGVAHDQRRLGRVQHDDGLAASRPADFDAIDATISPYTTSVNRATAATIGIVAWPPHVTMLTLSSATFSSRLTAGTTNGPSAAGVRSTSRFPYGASARAFASCALAEVASKTMSI